MADDELMKAASIKEVYAIQTTPGPLESCNT